MFFLRQKCFQHVSKIFECIYDHSYNLLVEFQYLDFFLSYSYVLDINV